MRTYKSTIRACFVGYIIQAIVNNFAPLLFLTFQSSYGISLSKITLLIAINFGVQLVTDMVAAKFVDKIGYKKSSIFAHILCAVGLISLIFLPELFNDAFIGLLIAVIIYAVGGGLLEVIISPIVEACPTDNKEKAMSLLHSFYCWGYAGVVLLSTLFFSVFGINNWKYLTAVWAVIPIANAINFISVPVNTLLGDSEKADTLVTLLKNKFFWLMAIIMICAGASEQAVSQWASTLAEKGLGVSKTVGDLAGPLLFAVSMGLSRVFYGKFGEKINLTGFMIISSVLCVVSYLLISLSPYPVLGFIGCGLCGISVGIMWPGTFSIATSTIKKGGTLMFALLALAGDLGCSLGPALVGMSSSLLSDNLKMGILTAIVFPVLMILCLFIKKLIVKKIPVDNQPLN